MGSQRGSSGVSSGQRASAAAAFGGGQGGSGGAGGPPDREGGGGEGGGGGGTTEQDAGRIAGVVQNTGGGPIQGARVELDRAEATSTDAAGAFFFENVGPGSHKIVVTATGCQPTQITVKGANEGLVVTLGQIRPS
jgi:hypothetical protein